MVSKQKIDDWCGKLLALGALALAIGSDVLTNLL